MVRLVKCIEYKTGGHISLVLIILGLFFNSCVMYGYWIHLFYIVLWGLRIMIQNICIRME